MTLAKEHIDNVCKLGQEGIRTCSFLMLGAGGFWCAKSTSFEATIRRRRDAGTTTVVGDNCSGPPDFTPSNAEPKFR